MTTKTLLLGLLLPACLATPELSETDSAITLAVAPINLEMRGDHVFYVGFDGSSYRAYELDEHLTVRRTSPGVAASSAPMVKNLTADTSSVVFGDGARNVRLSLSGAATQTFDAYGVFSKSLFGIGGVTLRDSTLSRLISGNGFGISSYSPIEVFSGPQATAAPVLSPKARSYVAPAGSYLRLVDVGAKTSSLHCKSATTYANGAISTSPYEQAGSVRVAAKLTNGSLVECVKTSTGSTLKTFTLPFDVGDLTYAGAGGVAYCDSNTGLCDPNGYCDDTSSLCDPNGFCDAETGLCDPHGIWVTSATTAEVAYVTSTAMPVIFSVASKYAPTAMPRTVRSFSDGSALVLMSNGTLARLARP